MNYLTKAQQQNMAEDKGKGKSRSTNDEISDPDASNSSFLSKVAASAAGLTRNAFSTPNSNEVKQGAAAVFSDSGKGQASVGSGSGSGSGLSTWAESSKAATSFPQAGGVNSLRAGHGEEHIQQSENEFSSFLDSIDSFVPSSEPLPEIGPQNQLQDVWARAQARPEVHPTALTVAEQESRDGEEVLNLLSGPRSLQEEFEAPPPEDENYDWGLTPQQISLLQNIAPKPRYSISADDPMNLVPLGDMSLEDRLMWRSQWEDVLTKYADEVWGGILPVVKEARREIDEMVVEGPVVEQPKALKRLGAILAHLQKR